MSFVLNRSRVGRGIVDMADELASWPERNGLGSTSGLRGLAEVEVVVDPFLQKLHQALGGEA